MLSLTENIRFIGVEDDDIDLFEGQYPVPAGISYNSYFIDDEHPAVVDAVDLRRCDDWLLSLADAVKAAGRRPEYLIVQHVEPDHSGSMARLLDLYPDIRVVCTAKALTMLGNFFEKSEFKARAVVVADNDTLSLGAVTLRFLTAPMVHWPEVMVTYDETEGVLFSADAFGSFAMSGSTEAWDNEARRYYTNIVGRFGQSVQSLLKKVSSKSISLIAPLHGPVIRENIGHYIGLYDKWSRYEPESDGVLVAYASIYGNTAQAARRFASMLQTAGASEVVLVDLSRHDVSYAVAEAFRFSHIALCSVTCDGDLFPAMHHFLHHLKSKNLRGRRVALIENGSWAPTAGRLMKEALATMKDMTVVDPIVTIHSALHDSDTPSMRALAENLLAH